MILPSSDLLYGLKAVVSGHRMTELSRQTVPIPPHASRDPATSRKPQSSDESARVSSRSTLGEGSRSSSVSDCGPVTQAPSESVSSPRDGQTAFVTASCLLGSASHRVHTIPKDVGSHQTRSVGHPVGPLSGTFTVRVSLNPRLFALRFRPLSEYSSLTGRQGYPLASLSALGPSHRSWGITVLRSFAWARRAASASSSLTSSSRAS